MIITVVPSTAIVRRKTRASSATTGAKDRGEPNTFGSFVTSILRSGYIYPSIYLALLVPQLQPCNLLSHAFHMLYSVIPALLGS